MLQKDERFAVRFQIHMFAPFLKMLLNYFNASPSAHSRSFALVSRHNKACMAEQKKKRAPPKTKDKVQKTQQQRSKQE